MNARDGWRWGRCRIAEMICDSSFAEEMLEDFRNLTHSPRALCDYSVPLNTHYPEDV